MRSYRRRAARRMGLVRSRPGLRQCALVRSAAQGRAGAWRPRDDRGRAGHARLAGRRPDRAARVVPPGRVERLRPALCRCRWPIDQQPLEAAATIDAAAAAFAITGDARWERVARDAFGWFFGDNDGGIPLADVADRRLLRRADGDRDQPQPGRRVDPRAATGGGDDGRCFRRTYGLDRSRRATHKRASPFPNI